MKETEFKKYIRVRFMYDFGDLLKNYSSRIDNGRIYININGKTISVYLYPNDKEKTYIELLKQGFNLFLL